MWLFKIRQDYQPVAINDQDEHDPKHDDHLTTSEQRPHSRRWLWSLLPLTILLPLLIILAILTTKTTLPHSNSITTTTTNQSLPISPSKPCTTRHEWRTLSLTQQQTYISSVLCLLTLPSHLHPTNPNLTLYSDFPYTHAHYGYRTHHAAPFLPWHRYLLHIYHRTLITQCGYPEDAGLVYWDWSLDAPDLHLSPVFDAETGFGGDGDADGEVVVGKTGRCVVDGPFAGVRAEWWDVVEKPHCLARGFRDDEGRLGRVDGREVEWEKVESVLGNEGGYEGFVGEMEARLHDVVPFGVAGDFETFTAPFDPLFFLHHVQLDRLWWLWQGRQPEGSGMMAYGGHRERHSMERAELDDWMRYGGLAEDVQVKDVMDVGNELLCYRYDG